MRIDTPYDSTPDASLQVIRTFEGSILVDLDETLYLQNSTEDFIDSASPALLVLLLLKTLDVLKPWRLTGGESTRDVWRVRLVRIFFPWVMLSWRRRVAKLASQHANSALIGALNSRALPPIVCTVGFRPIVTPLIAALGYKDAQTICCNTSFADRRGGKLQLVSSKFQDKELKSTLVVTDSPDDLPLLAACGTPLRTIWPAARYRPALSGVYVPGRYLTHVKRPNQRYIWRGIVQEDFSLWLFSTIGLASNMGMLALGLLFLLASFWAIYERGYVDNDQVAASFEQEPQLSSAFSTHTVSTPFWQPWAWAAALGGIGVLCCRYPLLPLGIDYFKWFAVLLLTELTFRVYNRFDKNSRIWMYTLLQFGRSAAFVVLVPISAIGAMALGAHVLSRWVPYYAYRLGGRSWPKVQPQLIRLLFFLVLAAFLALGVGVASVTTWSGGLLLAVMLLRARHELSEAVAGASRIDRKDIGTTQQDRPQ